MKCFLYTVNRYLKDSNFPLEESKRMNPGNSQNLEFRALESDIYVRICVAEAMQVKDSGKSH